MAENFNYSADEWLNFGYANEAPNKTAITSQEDVNASYNGLGDFNYGAAASSAIGLGNLALSYQNYDLAKESFNYNKGLSTNQFNASADGYNVQVDRYNAINNDITARRKAAGDTTANYTDKSYVAKM